MNKTTKRITIIRLLGIVTGGTCLFMIPSLIMAIILKETSAITAFSIPVSIGIILALCAILLIPKNRDVLNIRPRDGFLFVMLVWIISTLFGALSYYLCSAEINLIDAIFESACGFATTGATTINDIESMPRSLLLWRSMSQWAGGMGIILLFVALLPLIGVGGFQLVKAEVPGPEKEKVRPKIAETAKIIWGIYFVLTVVLIVLYKIGGMDLFDAVCHGFSIVSTGGVSTKNNGFGFYDSSFIDWVTVIFMLLGAMNFTLYFKIARGKLKDCFDNSELRAFLFILAVSAIIVIINLIPVYNSFQDAARYGIFQTVSILTTTGNTRTDYSVWPMFIQGIFFCLMLFGACSGSTGGGVKIIRHVVLFKQAANELKTFLYPRRIFNIKLNKKVGRKDVVYGVAGFIFLYFAIVGFSTLVTTLSGLDAFSALCTSLSMIGNYGVGFTDAGPLNNFSDFPDYLKLYYSLLMIAGRLELWTVFILFTPDYWKR